MSYDCVVDASVGIKLFLDEPLSERADALFDHLADDLPARFYVPDLFFIECANILWKYASYHGYPHEDAQQDVNDLRDLSLHAVPTQELVEAALPIALDRGITAYDASYVALAERLALPLVTADEPLARRLAATEYDVRWLGNWP
jgi:predicted nucleic acid-binding protein